MPLPNLLIIGAPKTGTTFVRKALSAHPDVFFPDTRPIEPHYLSFATEKWPSWAVKSIDEYIGLFSEHENQRYIGEKSTWYLYSECAPRLVAEKMFDCVAVVLLRDPVARAFSHYTFNRQNGWDPHPSFESALEWEMTISDRTKAPDRMYVEAGKYYEQLSRWFEALGDRRVFLLVQEDLQSDPVKSINDLYTFLGLSWMPANLDLSQKVNLSMGVRSAALPRLINLARGRVNFLPSGLKRNTAQILNRINSTKKPLINKETAQNLASIFQGDVRKLSCLVGRDLEDQWLKHYLTSTVGENEKP